ncbi:Zn(2)-C6 fungal-type DNA-binding domain [Fusarium oxysporum f. sp. vasinfectum]|uniref:Uncharacterized protein n=1 Tax=Fusarium oxysporum f. sp. vasinfectum 25433 TaxID=1089449 RepID=X0L2P5_FUSOX|nr:hypothetical protein FOTG_11773 [Fusarium oxysporum f. sp. vasinfectum 25433]KAK2676893.1 Zn(2)-C6 fungal-type DNA-binding domain [Fusarium oxysporum f. sp. vasinfectum]KAK2939721.1 Zn2-C6 fungal-type DNA-binding domain [Fusarium oxysporum f. sp. vasinfectum]
MPRDTISDHASMCSLSIISCRPMMSPGLGALMPPSTVNNAPGDPQDDLEIQAFRAPTNRFVCDCGKTYKRKEHLRRHQATHTAQPHKCHVCGQTYWRKDVLHRHLTTHEDNPSARPRACDACHANKTKCDSNGVIDCTFCKKKSIDCIYSPPRSRTRRSARPEGNEKSLLNDHTPYNAITNHPAQITIPAIINETSDISSMAKARSRSYRNALPPSISHIDPGPEPESTDVAAYLRMILRELSSSPSMSTTLQNRNSSSTFNQWLQDCFSSYVDHFHHRWHIITAPTYEFSEKSYNNAASVVVIGCYLLHKTHLKSTIVEIHNQLVNRYLQLLDFILKNKRIPNEIRCLETYQSTLLTIIFGLLFPGQEGTVARANLLCGRLIETLRNTDFLNQSHAQDVLQNEYPGDYNHWVEMFIDEWKRLVSNLFKVDTQLSFICKQNPRLLANELDATLPSSFAVRNCWDINVFLRRQQREASGRDIKMLWMIKHPDRFLPDPLLVEDIYLGLCGLAFDIFEQAQIRAALNTQDNTVADSIRESVVQRLAIWAKHIEVMAEKLSSDVSDPTDDGLVTAYLAREDETKGLAKNRLHIRRRINDVHSEAIMLYHRLQALQSASQ